MGHQCDRFGEVMIIVQQVTFEGAVSGKNPLSIDRGPLAKIISFRGTHLGNTWFAVYMKDIQVYCYQKSSKQKTCQILRKRVICDYRLLNCITAKKFESLNSTITKTTCIMRKSTKNHI